MSGTALAQLLGFALIPIISRLFSPIDFGVFGSFNAVTSIIAAAATLEYSQAIMLPKEKEDAMNLTAFSMVCALAISIACALFSSLFPTTMGGLIKIPGTWPLVMLVLATLVSGINQTCQAWAVRAKAFKHTSLSHIIRSLSTNSIKIGLGYLRAGAPGLIISTIIGNVLASINLVRVMLPDFSALRSRVRWKEMLRLAAEYRDFPMYSATQNVINALSTGLPVLLITRYFGIAVAGAYAFGVSMLQVPMAFVLTALRQVLFQKACEHQHRGDNLSTLYIRTTAVLFAMALLPSVFLIIWAPNIFSLFFGPQWRLAGELARSLIIWLAVSFCKLPAVLFARIIRIQRFVFFYDLMLLVLRTFALLMGGAWLSVHQTVMLFALVGATMNAFLIVYVGRAVKKRGGPTGWGSLRDMLIGG